jgi:hypothetical protein
MEADEQSPEGDSVQAEVDARSLVVQRFQQVVQAGDFRTACTMVTKPTGLEPTEDKQLRKDLSNHLSVDPVALAVFASCFTVLMVIAIASLFH